MNVERETFVSRNKRRRHSHEENTIHKSRMASRRGLGCNNNIAERAARLSGGGIKQLCRQSEEMAERDASANGRVDALTLAVQRLTNRPPNEILADRQTILKTARRGRPLPPRLR